MNEKYPEWLIRKIAAAAARGVDDTGELYGNMFANDGEGWSQDYIDEWEEGAVEVLDALGFHAKADGPSYWVSEIQLEGM